MHISDLFLSSIETKETNSYCEVVSVDLGRYESEHVLFDDLDVNITDVSVSDNDTLGLVYIGGYVAHSVLKGPNKSCSRCNECFTLTNVDSTYVPKADNFYFNIINRGSLKYPSDYVLYILTIAFKVFNVIISDRYEAEFLSRNKNHVILRSTIIGFLDLKTVQNCEECGRNHNKLIEKCLSSFCNILLNNYAKSSNDKLCKKKEKLVKSLPKPKEKDIRKRKTTKLSPAS